MKKLSLFSLVAALVWSAVALADSAVTQTRNLSGFSKIALQGSTDVKIEEGPQFEVKVIAVEKMQKRIKTTVSGDTLTIADEDGSSFSFSFFGHHDQGPLVTIVMPEFQELAISGSGDAKIQVSHPRDVKLKIVGSGDIRFHGPAKAMSIDISGSGDVSLDGQGESLATKTNGSGDIRARSFPVKAASVHSSGSGDVTLQVNGGPVSLITNGSGDIEWYGNAQQVTQTSSGSGDITHHG